MKTRFSSTKQLQSSTFPCKSENLDSLYEFNAFHLDAMKLNNDHDILIGWWLKRVKGSLGRKKIFVQEEEN